MEASVGGMSSSERRMAKYKEERRRQLASQIASRLSNAGRSDLRSICHLVVLRREVPLDCL
jgi:hypothetical protein